MYDFLIFEHSRLRNHFVDLLSIGRMLQESGYDVAIVDLDYNSELISNSGLPLVNLKCQPTLYVDSKEFWRQVIKEISPLAKNFYVGSVLSDTSLNWLKYFPKEKNVFIWGLRSFFFTYYRRFQISRYYPFKFLRSIHNLRFIRKNKNICLFVSDELIRDEFIELGIEPWRLVIRRERTCTKYESVKKKCSNPLKLLIIGTLRPEKRVDLCIDALESIHPSLNIELTIAGRAYFINNYDKMLVRRASQNSSIKRVDGRLSDLEYEELIKDSDFLLLCDERQPSVITNGTMAEALLSGRPIIAPNYDPYKYIVERYGVGILYDLYDNDSIIEALKAALDSNPLDYSKGLSAYQSDMMYKTVLQTFKHDMAKSLSHYLNC